MPDSDFPLMDRDFRPPNEPPSHTGWLWREKDGTLRATLSDIFNWPIHIVARKDGDRYYLQGWRGKPPEALRIGLIDGPAEVVEETEAE